MSSQTKKRPSIVKTVTLWYGGFFVGLGLLLFGAIVAVSDYYITSAARYQLEKSVTDSIDDYVEGDFEPIDEGVFRSRYSTQGQLIEGAVPITMDQTFSHNTLSETTVNNVRYLYYDVFDDTSKQWFRGIISVRQNDTIRRNLLQVLLIALPVTLAIILLGGYLSIKRALLPLKTFSQTAQAIKEQLDLSQRMPLEKTPHELQELAKGFNQMLDKVQDSYERERQFTSDASHELRTPLTVITSEIDYLKKQEQLPADFSESLAVIDRQSSRMNRLVNTLLDMDRLKQDEPTVVCLNLETILQDSLETYSFLATLEGKTLHYDVEAELYLNGEAQLLYRLIDNLLSNATKFAKSNLSITATKQGQTIRLDVANDGPAIPEKDLDKIWDRFYQTDPARQANGLGLGLSFVKSIADLHKATITVTSTEQETLFSLTFPSSS